MTPRTRVAAAGGTAFFLALAGSASASTAASDGTPQVVNREVVQAELDSSGKLDVARLFSQLSVVGKGTVDVADPTSSKGLRNLDGFDKPTVRDGKAIYTIHVDGSTSRRTVSDYTKTLPVTVNATYTLGGKAVRAKDIVGKTGDVTATYTVTNVSGVPTPVSWKDGKGATHTETVNLVTPLVGQIQTTLPGTFTDLDTPAADVAADGRGGSILTYSMVLFSPIGNETQRFTWSGHVKNGMVPAVEIQILPASPTQKPELNTGVIGYRDGAAQASELTAGAGLIDANLLKLQNGAGDLLAGLTKLAAGAADLQSGLAGQAAPGAKKLAAGAADAKAGSADLSSGLGDLSAGATKLAGGLGDAKDGSATLAAGLQQIVGGLDQLAGVNGLPAAKAGAQALRAGVTLLLAGLGDASTPGTILNGLAQASGGVSALRTAGAQLKGGVDQVNTGLGTAKTALQGLQAAVGGSVAEIQGAMTVLGCAPPLDATCSLLDSALNASSHGLSTVTLPGLASLESGTGTAITALTAISNGLAASNSGLATLGAGLTLVTGGINQIKLGLSHPVGAGGASDPGGMAQGLDALVAGLTTAVSGVLALDSGAAQAASGATALDSGLGQLDAGGTQVADGAAAAADGAGQLDAGLGQISTGASDLSTGITKAADGSKQLADGLNQAKAGNTQIVSGAGRLRSEGTSALVAGGNATAEDAGKKYATLIALSDKVGANALPYGAPAGATGSAAYQFTLAAADTTSHDNWTRGVVAGLLLLGACAVSWLLRRRFVTR